MDLACTNRCQSEGGVIMQTHAQQMKSASALANHATTWCSNNTCPRAERPWFRGKSWSEQLGDVGEPFLCARYFAGLMVDAQGIEPWTSPV